MNLAEAQDVILAAMESEFARQPASGYSILRFEIAINRHGDAPTYSNVTYSGYDDKLSWGNHAKTPALAVENILFLVASVQKDKAKRIANLEAQIAQLKEAL